MIGLVGIVIVFVMVFGGYLLAGGKMGIILKSLPYELTMIGGAATGAFVISSGADGVKQTLRDLALVFKGPRWKAADYQAALCLLYELARIGRTNPVALEEHVEEPATSSVFGRYPRIVADGAAVDLICDTLRSAAMNFDDPHQVEEVLDKQIEAHHQHAYRPVGALQTMADGLPALGIVAAVLGVIKTMASIDQPPEILGGLIGGALVGTFLGVFLSYGLVGPFAAKLGAVVDEDHHFYVLLREVLVAYLHNHAPNVCIEVGRQNTPRHIRPGFAALESDLRELKAVA